MRHSAESNRIEFLREFESKFKTALAHESGPTGLPFNTKIEGRKFRETVPLKTTMGGGGKWQQWGQQSHEQNNLKETVS
jgi:hypothetical protein